MGTCAGGVRFSNSNRIIHSDYRILLLLKMHIPSTYVLIREVADVNITASFTLASV